MPEILQSYHTGLLIFRISNKEELHEEAHEPIVIRRKKRMYARSTSNYIPISLWKSQCH